MVSTRSQTAGQSPTRGSRSPTPEEAALIEERDQLRLKQARKDALLTEIALLKATIQQDRDTTTQNRLQGPIASQQPSETTTTGHLRNSHPLPKPKDPHTFEGRDRADFDRWSREVNRFFRLTPEAFTSETRKVDFAATYLGERQQEIWERHEDAVGRDNVTWELLRKIMLDSMGTEEERKQFAYDRLQRIKQGDQTPSELLDAMKKLWIEIQLKDVRMQLLQFKSALNDNIRWKIDLNQRVFTNLVDLEEVAMVAYRQETKRRQLSSTKQYNGQKRSHQSTPSSDYKTNNVSKKVHSREEHKTVVERFKRPTKPVECWGCGQPGHKKDMCPNPDLWETQGKEQAQVKSS